MIDKGEFMNVIRWSLVVAAVFVGEGALAAGLDERPLAIGIQPAFPGIEWEGWGESEDGTSVALRPILLTHAGDGSGRRFVPTQQGVIYSIDPAGKKGSVFLSIVDKVAYADKTNEEGFLGLAFHPRFKENGEFFVYYTNKATKHQNVVARYRVKKDDPTQGDPASEEILLVFDKPFWNHDGGTILFGPDGYLYITHGDGGLGNDPFGNGQKLSTLLGKVLRIDVDGKSPGAPYGIPADNPFVQTAGARPEIFAYGLRNIWRMAFDAKTGELWAGDVGQDLWEEIDVISKGGNYGWNRREGKHPFAKSPSPSDVDPALVDPIFEYSHDVGKSITGGLVYRGREIPELDGVYLYADYVSGKMWGLTYDREKKEVTGNRPIPLPASIPVMSFGSDEAGEVYFMTYSANGQGIWRLTRAK
jgi:quinoprotein glucose dehydrogenase